MRGVWAKGISAGVVFLLALGVMGGWAAAEEGGSEEMEPRWEQERRTLEDMSREELEEEGFVFEDTLQERQRAHATLFAMTAGAVVPGAGHWQLDDSRTAISLVVVDATALALITAGTVLAIRPTERPAIDDRRYEMWFAGTGLLGTSWLVDIFGTAYRDDLGIPESTRRQRGWGVGARYEYVRPRELTLRHMWTTELTLRSRHLEGQLGMSQEFGWGMSDYFVEGRWFPLVSRDGRTRLGLQASGRVARYRMDEPFQRIDGVGRLVGELDLGRLIGHLDQMQVGVSIGAGARGERVLVDDQWPDYEQQALLVPMRMELALNLTDPLRLIVGYERGERNWLEPQASRLGHPTVELRYRSTERIDLHFQSYFGQGTGLGAGLRFWFGE